MKDIKILFLLVIASLGIFSCQKMEDIHEDYIKDGETIYAGKPYNPVAYPGDGRLKIKLFFENGGSIRNSIIEWNDGADQLITEVTPNLPLDSIDIIINDLEEKSYIFNVYNIDKEGHRSIKVPVAGSVYGDVYRQSLNNRIISSIEGGGTVDSLVITWGSVTEGNVGVELLYQNSDGNEIVKTVLAEDNRTVIRDWKSEGILKYFTKYIPSEGAIDTFRTSPEEVTLPKFISFKGEMLSKDKWEIVDFSSDEGEGRISNVIDGSYDTYWHTQYNGAQPGYPHYFVIDLKETVKINKMVAFNRKGDGRGHTEFQLLTSVDGVDFVDQGTFDNDPNSTMGRSCQLDDLPMARYVKFVATQGPNFFTFLAELDIYGQHVVADKIEKTDWEVISFSSQEPSEANSTYPTRGYASAAIDDNLETFWHTQYNGASPGYPHYIVVDMKKKVKIAAVEYFRRQGDGRGQTEFKILTSMDGEIFDEQGTYSCDPNTDNGQKFDVKYLPEARFFKYVATQGPNFFALTSEINIYGEVIK